MGRPRCPIRQGNRGAVLADAGSAAAGCPAGPELTYGDHQAGTSGNPGVVPIAAALGQEGVPLGPQCPLSGWARRAPAVANRGVCRLELMPTHPRYIFRALVQHRNCRHHQRDGSGWHRLLETFPFDALRIEGQPSPAPRGSRPKIVRSPRAWRLTLRMCQMVGRPAPSARTRPTGFDRRRCGCPPCQGRRRGIRRRSVPARWRR
jgi:hypothetical protein